MKRSFALISPAVRDGAQKAPGSSIQSAVFTALSCLWSQDHQFNRQSLQPSHACGVGMHEAAPVLVPLIHNMTRKGGTSMEKKLKTGRQRVCSGLRPQLLSQRPVILLIFLITVNIYIYISEKNQGSKSMFDSQFEGVAHHTTSIPVFGLSFHDVTTLCT